MFGLTSSGFSFLGVPGRSSPGSCSWLIQVVDTFLLAKQMPKSCYLIASKQCALACHSPNNMLFQVPFVDHEDPFIPALPNMVPGGCNPTQQAILGRVPRKKQFRVWVRVMLGPGSTAISMVTVIKPFFLWFTQLCASHKLQHLQIILPIIPVVMKKFQLSSLGGIHLGSDLGDASGGNTEHSFRWSRSGLDSQEHPCQLGMEWELVVVGSPPIQWIGPLSSPHLQSQRS